MVNASMPTINDVNEDFVRAVTPVSVLFGIFAVIAFFGNASVLIVHVFKYQSSNFRFFVLGLCAVDLISSVTILPLEIFTQLNWYVFPYSWLCKLKAFLHVFLSVSAVYVLLLIAIDRYRKICKPYGWQMTPRSLLIGYGISFIVVSLQSSSVVVIWGLQQQVKLYKDTNITILVCNKDPEYMDTIWPKIFPVIMIPSFVAMCVMLVLYCLVGRQIFQVVMKMRQHSKRKVQIQSICNDLRDNVRPTERKLVTSTSDSESVLSGHIRGEIESILCGNADVEAIEYKVNDGSIVCRNRSLKENSSVVRRTAKLSFKEKRKLEERSSYILSQSNGMVFDDNTVPDDNSIPGNSKIPDDNTVPNNNLIPDDNTACDDKMNPDGNTVCDDKMNPDGNTVCGDKMNPCDNTVCDDKMNSDDNMIIEVGKLPADSATSSEEDKNKVVDMEAQTDDSKPTKATADEAIVPESVTKPKLCWKETLRPKLQPLRGIQSLSKRVAFSVKPRDKLKRRTLITFVFTAIFIATTITYMIISGHVVNAHAHSNEEMVVVLFFYRLYFINCAIHPIIYGLLDPKFRKIVKCSKKSLNST